MTVEGPRILIVDDSLTVRMDLGEALTDAGLDNRAVSTLAEARHAHLSKLVERDTFGLCPMEHFDRSCELFPPCWVDKKRSGVVKCRFTVADVKKRYSKQALEDERSCSTPTPSEEAHACFEIYALKHGLLTRSLDIVQAFTIGLDPGGPKGNPVYVRTCKEFQPFIDIWTKGTGYEGRSWDTSHLRVDGNLFGRRTAPSVYRDEFERRVVALPGYAFERRKREPTLY